MKQPERVAELLNELRTLAENDFERHRLDVLERDLTKPPKVEIVDETHQKFNGVTYKKNTSGHYSKDLRIHQAVWSYYNGKLGNVASQKSNLSRVTCHLRVPPMILRPSSR